MDKEEKRHFYNSLVFPTVLVVILWIIKGIEYFAAISFARYGMEPQTLEGLQGIVFSPFLHADFKHLIANSLPLFLLTAALIYYYRRKGYVIFLFCWIITQFWVWIFAKDTGVHIGASGIVYALAAFHLVGGMIKREPRMMAFALLVIFLYGSLIWGVFPYFLKDENISWQSHLMGLLAGIVIALAYKNEGPQAKRYEWNEDEDVEDDENAYWKLKEDNEQQKSEPL